MKNSCEQQKLCDKMRNAALKEAIAGMQFDDMKLRVRERYINMLSGTLNLLKSYECLPCSVLVARIEFILLELEKRNIEYIRDDEEVLIRMLLKELEAFIKG